MSILTWPLATIIIVLIVASVILYIAYLFKLDSKYVQDLDKLTIDLSSINDRLSKLELKRRFDK